LLHFPTATFIAWSKLYDPSKLNIDDLEITDNQLVSCVFSSQLEIQALEKYALWQRGGDYQYVVLRHPIAPNDFDTRTLPLWKKIWKKVASFI
jgi:hypothetical protein